ncbi:MAG: AAA family ATPase [Methylobacter sp.]
MKQILINNLVGIKHADITLSPVTMLCGDNGAGKSSIGAAIRMALTGDVERITLKKNIAELAHNRAKDYGSKVTMGEAEYSFGKMYGNKHLPSSADRRLYEIVTGATKLAEASSDYLQKLIIDLSGISLTADEVKKRLSGHDQGNVDRLLPFIRKSFDEAETEAKKQATGARAVWKSVTGETYGENKAADWKAEQPETDTARRDELVAELDFISTQIAQLKTLKTEQETTNNELSKRIAKRDGHKANADKLTEYQDLLNAAELALDEHKASIERLEGLASGTPEPIKYPCPCCDKALMWHNGKLEAWSHEGKAPDLEAKTALKALIESLDSRIANVNRRKKDVETANTDKLFADELDREIGDQVPFDISDIAKQLNDKQRTYTDLNAELTNINVAINKAAGAEAKTITAQTHHKDVLAWSKLAEEMALDGLRKQLISMAVGKINDVLNSFSGVPLVRIGNDMKVTLDDRSYYLLSESEQWRVNTILSLSIAIISDLKFSVIDRFDVLHVSSRPSFLRLFAELTNSGRMNTIILCATLKESPKLPEPFSVYWIENGMVIGNTD